MTFDSTEIKSEDTYLDGRLEFEQYRLRDENLSGLGAQIADLSLQQLDLLPRPAASHLQEPVYDGIQVHLILCRHCHRLLLADGEDARTVTFVTPPPESPGARL